MGLRELVMRATTKARQARSLGDLGAEPVGDDLVEIAELAAFLGVSHQVTRSALRKAGVKLEKDMSGRYQRVSRAEARRALELVRAAEGHRAIRRVEQAELEIPATSSEHGRFGTSPGTPRTPPGLG